MVGRVRRGAAVASVLSLLVAACGPGGGESGAPEGPLRIYTSVTQDTVDAVLDEFERDHPDLEVEVFRAPTGELDARLAAERREGQILADLLWGTDPLSVQIYDADGLFLHWSPADEAAVPEAYRTDTFWGTRLLNLVIVHRPGLDPAPASWSDLAAASVRDGVAIPDPGFAGSAFAALGYFATTGGFGMDYYRELRENGAVQVAAVPEVLTGVAEGRFVAGMTLDKIARDAIEAGSPVEMVWPEPGAIAVYSPIAIFESSEHRDAARAFVDHVLSAAGQAAIASTGWQPIRDDVEGPPIDGGQVAPDWPGIFDRQQELLDEYRSIFGG